MAHAELNDFIREVSEERLSRILRESYRVPLQVHLEGAPRAFVIEIKIPAGKSHHGKPGTKKSRQTLELVEVRDETPLGEAQPGVGMLAKLPAVLIDGVTIQAAVLEDVADEATCGFVVQRSALAHSERCP